MTVLVLKAAKYLASQSNWTLSNLKMQKILYIINMYYIGEYFEPLVEGCFEAWDYGPVHPELYHYVKVFGANPVGDIFQFIDDVKKEDSKEKTFLDAAVKQLAGVASARLVATTHREDGAWAKNYIPGRKHVMIPNSDILEEYNMVMRNAK